MNFLRAWQSGRSVGTPGTIALYEETHQQHGRLKRWRTCSSAAIELAEQGFEVSPRLAGFLARVGAPTQLDDNPGHGGVLLSGR